MRSFALFYTLTIALGSAACNEQQSAASATETTTSAIDETPDPTTGAPMTTTTTTGEPDTTTGSTTELVPPTTTSTPTTTGATTGDITTTTTTTTTGEPDTTGGETTEGAIEEADPYESCSNEMNIACKGDAICVDDVSTSGQVQGSYCAPKCVGGMMNCQKPMEAGPNTSAVCAFDTDADMTADICALICNLANDDCGNGTACEDIGIPDMDVNGIIMQFGVCTHAG